MTRVVLVALGAFAVAGCATSPTSSETAEPVVSAHAVGTMTADRGVISVIRDRGVMGMACKFYIAVDSVEVGFVETGQRLEFGADPGERTVTASTRGICGGGTANATVNVTKGETRFLRVGSNQSGDLRLEPAAPGYR